MKRVLLLALLGLSLAGCVYAGPPGPGYYHRDYYYRY
jgi:hypothetical protein